MSYSLPALGMRGAIPVCAASVAWGSVIAQKWRKVTPTVRPTAALLSRKPSDLEGLANLRRGEVLVLGVPAHIAGDDLADGDDVRAQRAHIVQRRLDQGRAIALTFVLGQHLGVREEDRVR